MKEMASATAEPSAEKRCNARIIVVSVDFDDFCGPFRTRPRLESLVVLLDNGHTRACKDFPIKKPGRISRSSG
jgi:hypothetical protein